MVDVINIGYNLDMDKNEVLKNKLKDLPRTPGVYRFLSEERDILYVGMSKHLRERVRSYFTGEKEGKIARLVHQISDLEVELCDTYLEAKLLECRRIKELKPPYNAQFKREKGFVYLKIRESQPGSPLAVTTDPEGAIGPFRNRRLLEKVLMELPKLFPISLQEDGGQLEIRFSFSVLPRRLDRKDFMGNRDFLERLFSDETLWLGFMEELDGAMLQAAEKQLFSEAIFFRDFKETISLLHRLWFEDRELFQSLLFLRIPSASGGLKYYRVCNGMIEDMGQGSGLDPQEFKVFCRGSSFRPDPVWTAFPEKARWDFRDVLYSEIRSLPEEQVVKAEELFMEGPLPETMALRQESLSTFNG